jgi:NitT/TauT family transport system permease protein
MRIRGEAAGISDLAIKTAASSAAQHAAEGKLKGALWPALSVLSFTLALVSSLVLPNKQVKLIPVYYQIVLGAFIAFLIANLAAGILNKKHASKFFPKGQLFFALGLVFLAWDFFSAKTALMPLPFYPGPTQIVQEAVADYELLLVSSAHSLRLFALGFSSGIILGISTGILISWYAKWNYWLFPVIRVIGIIPAVALIPIAMGIFPSSLMVGTFLITMCLWFPIAFMTRSGISNINKAYFETAKTLGANESYLIWRVAVPGALPSIFTGVSTGIALSFATLVVSEMVGAKAGLGWYLNWAKGWSVYSKVYASIIVMGIEFAIILRIIGLIQSKLLVWQKGLVK